MGIWTAVRNIAGTAGWLLNSLNEAGLLARVMFLPVILLAGGAFLVEFGGLVILAAVVLTTQVVTLVVLSIVVSRRVGIPIARQWRAVRPPVYAGVGSWTATTAVVYSAAPALGDLVALIAGLLAGVSVYVCLLEMVERGLLKYTTRQVARTFGVRSTSFQG